MGLIADAGNQYFWLRLGLRSLYSQWLALTAAAILCATRPWLIGRFGPQGQSLATLMAVAMVSLALSDISHRLMMPPEEYLLFLGRNLAVVMIFTGLLLRYLYVQYLHHIQAAAEARARLQALQSRIRPHFLFNSMNTIATLTRINPKLAETVVVDLADLFRASLLEIDKLSTLGEELRLVRHYLDIEGLRLGKRLRVEWSVDGLPEEAALPRLTLQPLLENAVYHGIEKLPEGGIIRVIGDRQGDWIVISLSNPISSLDAEQQKKGQGMALENVRQRLHGVFGECARLTEVKDSARYQIQLEFPLLADEDSDRRR
ncbi:MAG: sensor histidine kinase [Gammaproteobacteria bacterium]|nr:sensor histidine kinase [Gammaproteobacteria bacterium]MBU1656227.1 sensor histidine kinase [Gammaproteobacteria bacterium]MBU1959792.1 sensor histidine kinase [Gammaproteobacteria bacterium]